MPEWLASLDEEDVSFIKKFVLASGSLKEVAGIYGVTYPTVRLRGLLRNCSLSACFLLHYIVLRDSGGNEAFRYSTRSFAIQ